MRVPSGDQSGPASALVVVRRANPLPSAFTAQTSGYGLSTMHVNASRLAFGDHVGLPRTSTPLVRRVTLLPFVAFISRATSGRRECS